MKTLKVLIAYTILIFITFTHAQTFSDSSAMLNPLLNTDNDEGGTWGASAADFNNDGFVDIFHEGRLYLNEGINGFNDIIESTTGIDITTYGAIFGDYNNDGYLDIFMEDPIGSKGSFLFKNNRARSFISADIDANIKLITYTQGCAWIDFNLDGKLDLFVGNDFGSNQLFKNLDHKSFEDITSPDIQNDHRSYGIAWGDFNNDLYPDMIIAPCHPRDKSRSAKDLYLNNGNETFTNINISAGVHDSLASWGVIWLNYNNDDFLDIYIANMEAPDGIRPGYNKLYRNNGDSTFTDVSDSAGVSGDWGENSFGIASGDFDNDGWVDIYVANEGQAHRLYRNNGNGTFTDMAEGAGIIEDLHKAVAVADFNNDGWLDIFTAGTPANRLMINNGGENHWISIKTRGTISNSYGIGARVEVYTQGMKQIREVNSGDSYCSQSDNLNIHFGLGSNASVDSIIVRWPSGGVDVINNVEADQYISIVEGVGINNPPSSFKLIQLEKKIISSSNPVLFSWHRATDFENDELAYTLYISSGGKNVRYAGIADTTISIDTLFSSPDSIYNWTVDVEDGYSITASYDLNQFIRKISISTINEKLNPPKDFSLKQNYPNPFNPRTSIEYSIPKSGHVVLTLFDLAGKRVQTLVDKVQSANSYSINFEADKLASGIYVYKLTVDNKFSSSKKMLLLRLI